MEPSFDEHGALDVPGLAYLNGPALRRDNDVII